MGNGKISDYHMFPFISYIFTGLECTASILNQYFILTAAHCVVDKDTNTIYPAKQITAYVGLSSKTDPNKANRGYPVSRVFIHPDYRTGQKHLGHADVALLQLSKPIQYVDGIKNGCIDYSESIKSYYIMAGYGRISISERDDSGKEVISARRGNELRYAYAKENRDEPQCQKEGLNNVCLESYDDGSGEGACNGDSGGPLLTPDLKICAVFNIMLGGHDSETGYSTLCNGRQAYTRLSRYRDFIESHVDPSTYCWSS